MVRRNIPLVEQVIFELLSEIDRGGYARDGGMLPSEADLALRYAVSRATVRDALSRLEATGVVIRRHGVGTLVNPFLGASSTALQDWFEEAHGFVDALRNLGRSPETRVLRSEIEPAGAIAARLQVAESDPVIVIEKVISAMGAPVIHSFNALPLAVLPPEAQAEGAALAAASESTFKFLEIHCHRRVHHQQSETRAALVGERLAALLGCQPEDPCLLVDEVAYSVDLMPLFYGLNHFRGDSVSFRQIRRPTLNLTNFQA